MFQAHFPRSMAKDFKEEITTHVIITYSKKTIKTPEKGVKYVQS